MSLLCASLNLSMLTRNARRHSPGPGEVPADISPFQTSVVTGLTLVVLTIIRHLSVTSTRKC